MLVWEVLDQEVCSKENTGWYDLVICGEDKKVIFHKGSLSTYGSHYINEVPSKYHKMEVTGCYIGNMYGYTKVGSYGSRELVVMHVKSSKEKEL